MFNPIGDRHMAKTRFPTKWHADRAKEATERALEHLQKARDELAYACAPKTLERVRAAISSAKGAVRNADYRISREYFEARRAEEDCDRELLVVDRSHAAECAQRIHTANECTCGVAD
jgi:hypothetical protein